ncbi:DUF3251 domain-containing protein [Nevskia soli]|uniref:DUF3251 domain-containing protein n=1 Tax=Nevskia soli TaxID=418856 RepID=UPI000A075514|nr:DUF3251 domain-containing protein [Nevskia soli]
MNIKTLTIGLCVALALGACKDNNDTQQLQRQIDALEKKVQSLENAAFKPVPQVQLDPATKSYDYYEDGRYRFAFAIENIRQQADGLVVQISIGNLSTATFSGVSFTVDYGRREGESENPATWYSSVREIKNVTAPNDIFASRWNIVEVSLPNIKQEDFGYLSIMDVNSKSIQFSGYAR